MLDFEKVMNYLVEEGVRPCARMSKHANDFFLFYNIISTRIGIQHPYCSVYINLIFSLFGPKKLGLKSQSPFLRINCLKWSHRFVLSLK